MSFFDILIPILACVAGIVIGAAIMETVLIGRMNKIGILEAYRKAYPDDQAPI